jgi:HAD superfamily hydrolase (TIGR01490 family)
VAVAAFFDIDGTLISKNSGPLYMKFLRSRGEIRRGDAARTIYLFLRYKLGMLDIERAAASSSGWIRGKSEQAVAEHCRLWYREMVRQYLQPEMVRRVRAHQAEGHVVALLSSSTPYLATPLAEDLGIEHMLVSRLVIENGRFTGDVHRPICYGAGKIHWARRFAEEHDVDLGASWFYTDSVTDLPMLELVGHPEVVNPDPRLRREARRRGWNVMQLDVNARMPETS